MTRIDERGPPIKLTDANRRRLADLFSKEPDVVAAYLYGSQARGRAGPLSDVDLAVWLDPALDRHQRWKTMIELMGSAGECLDTNEVQVVVLNTAPPLLVDRALRHGIRLADNAPTKRIRLETRAALDFLDLEPLRKRLSGEVSRRIEEGHFGRC